MAVPEFDTFTSVTDFAEFILLCLFPSVLYDCVHDFMFDALDVFDTFMCLVGRAFYEFSGFTMFWREDFSAVDYFSCFSNVTDFTVLVFLLSLILAGWFDAVALSVFMRFFIIFGVSTFAVFTDFALFWWVTVSVVENL